MGPVANSLTTFEFGQAQGDGMKSDAPLLRRNKARVDDVRSIWGRKNIVEYKRHKMMSLLRCRGSEKSIELMEVANEGGEKCAFW